MNNSERSPAPYDLHLHCYWSYDATAEGEAHFKRARELGVRYIAITDHHVMDASAQVLECDADLLIQNNYRDEVAIHVARDGLRKG